MRSVSAIATAIASGSRQPSRSDSNSKARRCTEESWRFVTLKNTEPRCIALRRFSSGSSISGPRTSQHEARQGSQWVEPRFARTAGESAARQTPVPRSKAGVGGHARSSTAGHGQVQEVRPNQSFKRRATGMALGPRAAVVHHAARGPSATPASPA